MTRIILARPFLFLFLALLTTPLHAFGGTHDEPALSAEEVFARAAPSVFVVLASDNESNSSQGSGVVVRPEYLVTNRHVIERAQTIVVKHGEESRLAFVAMIDPVWDLAILHVPGLTRTHARLRESATLRTGERAYGIGAPHGLELTLTEGLISSLRSVEGQRIIQTSAALSVGSSGGGLFDSQGRLIGITTFRIRGGEGLAFALPANLVVSALHRLHRGQVPDTPPTLPQSPGAVQSVEGVYKAALTRYSMGDYDLAIAGFRSYMKTHSQAPHASNAQYLLADSYYSKKNYAEAIEEFRAFVRDYPDSISAPSALLKVGEAFLRLGDTGRATAALCELIGTYPNSPGATLATRDHNPSCR